MTENAHSLTPTDRPIKPGVLSRLLKALWGHPLAKDLDVDDPQSIVLHHQIIQQKPLLKAAYLRWYREYFPAYQETKDLGGEVLELGSGSGFLEELIPELIKTDVVPTPLVPRAMNAMNLDFGDEELRAIFMTHVLHHVPSPAEFLEEAMRCLKPGGRLVMVEPSNGFFQRFLAKWLDHFEHYDDTITEWKNKNTERMTDANMALSWVIFVRDQERFKKEFPRLHIRSIRYHTFLSYAITGGFTYRAFLPSITLPLLQTLEFLTTPFMPWLGTMMTIDLEKI
jgi:SAM-dependent methyltransferase